jgi:hypothetical protein
MLRLIRDHHAVDEDARDLHLPRIETAALGEAFNLHDDDPVGVADRHGNRERFERQRFPFHGDVALGVRRRAADDAHRDREGLVEEELFASNLQEFDQILRGAGVDLSAAKARIDESPEADAGQVARPMGGNVSE